MELGKNELIRLTPIDELDALLKGFIGLTSISHHHVVPNLNAVSLDQLGDVLDQIRQDLLANVFQNLFRCGLDTQADPFASRHPHRPEEIFIQAVCTGFTAPDENKITVPNLPADFQGPVSVGRKVVIFDRYDFPSMPTIYV